MKLEQLRSLLAHKSCSRIYVKSLAVNDNDRQQVYFGKGFDKLHFFPINNIQHVVPGSWKKSRFIAEVPFFWLDDAGRTSPAPHAKFILYPKYPEVRFSGFLNQSEHAPAHIMTHRVAGRLLFLAPDDQGNLLGYAADVDSEIAREFRNFTPSEKNGVFSVIELQAIENSREKLLKELARIHKLGWIESKRLDKQGKVLGCYSPNCGGYTLEAELGIRPNGYAEPDYLGWEVKQFGVKNLNQLTTSKITLMTPEPTGGIYVKEGTESFTRRFGYLDKMGRADRINFGGSHYFGSEHQLTRLTLTLPGYDIDSGTIISTDGRIALSTPEGEEAASWNFSSLLLHWTRKHDKACYVPSLHQKGKLHEKKYQYGNKILLGEQTDFGLFLKQVAIGNIYYDPGIKLEMAGTHKPVLKRRSQFRVKSAFLDQLYKKSELITIE